MNVTSKGIINKYCLIRFSSLLVLSIILLALVSCEKGTTTEAETETDFNKVTVSQVTISSSQVVLGDTVTLAVNVMNAGTNSVQDYPVSLKINDINVESQNVAIQTGETKTVTFQYVPKNKGNYLADINGQTISFDTLKAASFLIGEISIAPVTPVAGQDIIISTEVKNEGDVVGKYQAKFKLDGTIIHTEDLQISAGQTVTVSTSYSTTASGIYLIEFANVSKSVKILKPADFKVESIRVEPDSIYLGETANVKANISNSGEDDGTIEIPLIIDGVEKTSHSITLSPGASETVIFSVTPDKSGSISLDVLGSIVTLDVVELKTYTSAAYHYTISYPPDYDIYENGKQTVSIESSSGGLSILIDQLSIASSPEDYFNGIAAGKKSQLPDWTYSSKTNIVENGTPIGYRYDYTNTTNGKKWIGKGMVIKKGGLGFNVVFTTSESDWKEKEPLALLCLSSFESPLIITGSYMNDENGIALTLSDEWTAIDTKQTNTPVFLIGPYQYAYQITGQCSYEIIVGNTTAQEYAELVESQLIEQGFQLVSKGPFQFENSVIGYESVFSATTSIGTFKIRSISVASSSRIYSIIFVGTENGLDFSANSITQMTKSLVLSIPGMAGINKNETLFLLEWEVPTLDPALSDEAPNGIVGAIFSGLVRIDNDLKPVPDIAERWTVSSDGMTYTFYLNNNVKFHNGKQVTANDIKYSWERACDPALASPKASYFLNDIVGAGDVLDGKATEIRGIRIIDDFTLEVSIDAPKQYFVQKLSQVVTYVVDRENVEQGEDWYKQPNGTGPFKLKSWKEDERIILERFENFYEGPVRLKNIVFNQFAGYSMILYESGEIDMTTVSTDALDRVLDITNPLNKELYTGVSASVEYIGINVKKPPFDDPKVREAFALALDVNKLIEVTMKDQADRAAGYIPPLVPGYNDSLQPVPYDIEKAKQLITESKYGSISNLPSVTLYNIYGTSSLQQAIIGMWQQNLGVQVRVETISELETYYTRMRNDEFQVYVSGWIADYIDPQNFLDVLFQSRSTENCYAYSNPEVDAALELAAAKSDEDARIQMYQDIEQLILADLPAIPLTNNSKNYFLVKPYVKGFTMLPISTSTIWRDIYVEVH